MKFIFVALLCVVNTYSQEDAKLLYQGNNQYFDSNYVHSTSSFREALKINPKNYKASFNLGNAMYRNAGEIKNTKMGILQGKQKVSPDSLANLVYEEAAQNFAIIANTVSDKDTLHRAWHNIGNCYLQKKDWDQAITAYKKALKFDPKDEDTRYNLAYALKNRPPKQNKGGGQSQQQQNQNQKQQQQQQQQQISKEDAERLLKALMNAEKKTQDKRKQKQEDASKSDPDKDW
ncbi:MAG: tetratricopeptide repeat protein [Bacteroidia bacterium]|nr:tetratricopeptide repeat protein [Sphingobacteriaceae bacterium]MBP9068891.1 tetratricopeptide repeat protein [Bacteroidia bacterium]